MPLSFFGELSWAYSSYFVWLSFKHQRTKYIIFLCMKSHLECSIGDCPFEALAHIVIADLVQESNTNCRSLIYYIVLKPENLDI